MLGFARPMFGALILGAPKLHTKFRTLSKQRRNVVAVPPVQLAANARLASTHEELLLSARADMT